MRPTDGPGWAWPSQGPGPCTEPILRNSSRRAPAPSSSRPKAPGQQGRSAAPAAGCGLHQRPSLLLTLRLPGHGRPQPCARPRLGLRPRPGPHPSSPPGSPAPLAGPGPAAPLRGWAARRRALPPLRSLPFPFPRRLLGGGRRSLRERRGRREESAGAPPGRRGAGRWCSRALAASEAIGSAQSPHAGLQRRPPRIGARAGSHRGARGRVRAARATRQPTDSGLGSPCS